MSFPPQLFKFLKDLKAHNDRAWFQENRERYDNFVKLPLLAFIGDVGGDLAKISRQLVADPSPTGGSMFRIHRDTRFAKDKSPYKTHFGAHISGAAKAKDFHDTAGYYIHIEPGASLMGGGAYMPSPVWLKAIRDAIDRDGGSLKKIVTSASFKKYFGKLDGEVLKRNPPGFRPDHLYMDFLKHKSFLAMHSLKDKDVLAPGFPKHAETVFKAMLPLNRFLNEALEEA
jgi:uncharacterized protein (TIGR02453 family)